MLQLDLKPLFQEKSDPSLESHSLFLFKCMQDSSDHSTKELRKFPCIKTQPSSLLLLRYISCLSSYIYSTHGYLYLEQGTKFIYFFKSSMSRGGFICIYLSLLCTTRHFPLVIQTVAVSLHISLLIPLVSPRIRMSPFNGYVKPLV